MCREYFLCGKKAERERERSRREIRQQKFCVKKSKQITKKARKEQ